MLVLSLLTVIAITLFLSFYIKSDSSLGRLLIYKISFKMFLEHPITGIGWGNFQREYNLYQAAFFKSGNYTQKEFLLADNTFYAFNDYWQLIVETGLVGGLCLITFIIFLTIKTYIHLKTEGAGSRPSHMRPLSATEKTRAFSVYVIRHFRFRRIEFHFYPEDRVNNSSSASAMICP